MVPINVPNVLTLLRILAVPVIVVALLGETPNGDALAAGVFALAAITDGLDGYIARRRQDVTTFGKLMDPLADKLLIVAALVSLVSLNRLAAWVAMVIIARELAVTGLRAVAVEQGVVISASWLGKVKTTLQVAAVFALITWNPSPWPVDALVYVAVAATVISGLDYFFGLRRRLAEERAQRTAAKAGEGEAGAQPGHRTAAKTEPGLDAGRSAKRA
jgi:CDP-diacylglycerol--glycerol-3-phosphate 3-phosphatidyltransferase